MPRVDLIWPELVLHVLAHLETTASLPSSLYSETYVGAARQNLGAASERALGADVELLSSQLTTHEALSRVQILARLHPTLDAARRLADLDLASLGPDGYTNIALRDALVAQCRIPAELLRCAALLEADTFLRWPLPESTLLEHELEARLPDFWKVAPRLRSFPVRMLRVLGMRGRLWPDMIAVGIPVEQGEPSMDHVLWQAAHEATVTRSCRRGSHDSLRESDMPAGLKRLSATRLTPMAPQTSRIDATWSALLRVTTIQPVTGTPRATRFLAPRIASANESRPTCSRCASAVEPFSVI